MCQSPSSFTSQHPGSTAVVSEYPETSQYLSSPGSVEVSSEAVITSNANCLEITERTGEVDKALRRLEEQLSLNDDSLKGMDPFYSENENSNDSEYVGQDQFYSRSAGMQETQSVLCHNSIQVCFLHLHLVGKLYLTSFMLWSHGLKTCN